jgi:hypothetical protein
MPVKSLIPRVLILSVIVASTQAWSHDPVFGLGPHVLFKGGVEIAPQYHVDKAGDEKEHNLGLELTYGLTGDWAAGVEIPYVDRSNVMSSESGQGDISVFTKYRFWRKDSPGLQQSMTVAAKLNTDSGENGIGTGTTDGILGLAYGYEGRKWYRWAAVRHRFNGENGNGLRRGDKTLLDLVGGIRLKQTGYREPDTVWLLELNGELAQRAELNGAQLANTGGTEWFVSPGIFWTLRNFAVKAGVQIPVTSNLNGAQEKTDYRAKVVLEWHL